MNYNLLKNVRVAFLTLMSSLLLTCGGSDDGASELTLITSDAANVTRSSVTFSGELVSNGGETIIERGFRYSTSPSMTVNLVEIPISGTGLGSFSTTIDIGANTTYYYRTYARTSTFTHGGNIESFTTLPNDIAFRTDKLIDYGMLQNKEDNILYVWLYDVDGSTLTDFEIIAYNYQSNQVVAQKNVGLYLRSAKRFIGEYNGQRVLYHLSLDTVHILNPITLADIASFTIPDASSISSIEQLDDLIFISYLSTSSINLIATYNAQNFQQISFADLGHLNGNLVYRDPNNSSHYASMSYGDFNTPIVRVHTFDENGVFLNTAQNNYNNTLNNYRAKTNENANFVIEGGYGTIYNKLDYSINLNNPPFTTLNEDNEIEDYVVSNNGNFVYTIQNNNQINKYSTSTFALTNNIHVSEKGRYLFFDTNEFIVIDYANNAPDVTERDIYIVRIPNF